MSVLRFVDILVPCDSLMCRYICMWDWLMVCKRLVFIGWLLIDLSKLAVKKDKFYWSKFIHHGSVIAFKKLKLDDNFAHDTFNLYLVG